MIAGANMTAVHITQHAFDRYRERVADITEEAIRLALDTPAVRLAVKIGAPYVRLATRQRIVIAGNCVVTILPSDHATGRMGRDSDKRRHGE